MALWLLYHNSQPKIELIQTVLAQFSKYLIYFLHQPMQI
jgi:hypothetical protein